ncbi:bile acid:sodium symporter family protein [Pontibacterium sp.]|uniref:bile acid:sodium symporter family protein n=1 Tax=Pontibacterium sp. TaxID=2036026 RepID=UPI0035156434
MDALSVFGAGEICMKKFIERNFNLVLFLSLIVGMTVPGIEHVPNFVVSVLLGIIVFFLCSKISLSEIKAISVKEVSAFYLARFIALPVGMFYLANLVVPQYAVGILLLALMPAGISTPVFVSTQKGNVSLAFLLMLASSLLAPVVVPMVFALSHSDTEIELLGIFYTLTSVILVPFAAYFALTSVRPQVKPFIERNNAFVSVVFLGIIIAVVISKQREEFLSSYNAFAVVVAILSLMFLLFYVFGWLFTGRQGKRADKVCYSFSSGANNTAVGINLALVYFSADTIFFMVLSELTWVLAIPAFNFVLRRFQSVAYSEA